MMVNVVTEILSVYIEPYSNCLHTIHIFLPYKEYQLYKSRTKHIYLHCTVAQPLNQWNLKQVQK